MEEQPAKIGKTLLDSFLGTLGNTGINPPPVIDTVEIPEVKGPNYTPLYLIGAIVLLGVFFILINFRK